MSTSTYGAYKAIVMTSPFEADLIEPTRLGLLTGTVQIDPNTGNCNRLDAPLVEMRDQTAL